MILAIDVGNSNIVLGCIDGEKLYFTARVATNRSKTSDEYAVIIKSMLELNGMQLSNIEGGIISSVVPAVTVALKGALRLLLGKEPMVVGAGIKTGLNILIDNPGQLGSDLVVDAVAALAEYPRPILIFDLGTATTLSVVDDKGSYLGGMIIPGVTVSLEALSSGTSQLPHISLEDPKRVVGTNTVDCMKSGIIYGNAAMLDGIVDRVEQELGQKATTVATGGLARVIVPYCQRNIICDDNLMLKGLRIIYQKNKDTWRDSKGSRCR
ncbi:MAG TPA: type III pantothenate kinase [Candidatus Gallacutalibacter stercoravium]|nr:type III pantothenate kinase [Candidatus Gallacutalibacter stercoravium]